jgi:tripartite-type tricarboxylate transporter receptor subunit TctC
MLAGKRFIVAVAALFMAGAATAVYAQADYPNRPVRLIVGFPAGSAADITARVLGNRMIEHRRRVRGARAEGRLHAVPSGVSQHHQCGD